MGQSQAGYLSELLRREASTTSARSHGSAHRARGGSSDGNPFLFPEALPALTNEDQAHWLVKCEAWRRGWDEEDTRRSLHGQACCPTLGEPCFAVH